MTKLIILAKNRVLLNPPFNLKLHPHTLGIRSFREFYSIEDSIARALLHTLIQCYHSGTIKVPESDLNREREHFIDELLDVYIAKKYQEKWFKGFLKNPGLARSSLLYHVNDFVEFELAYQDVSAEHERLLQQYASHHIDILSNALKKFASSGKLSQEQKCYIYPVLMSILKAQLPSGMVPESVVSIADFRLILSDLLKFTY